MSERRLPASLEASPFVADWLGFDAVGNVRVRSGRVELGQGNATALLQIAADELDVRPDQVNFVAGDTRETPNEGFTSGSLSIQVGGQALRLAASAARHLLLAEAATLLQTTPDRLTVRGGAIFVEGRETDLDYWKLAQRVPLAVPVADHARPKAPAERALAGRSMPRTDLAAKLSGGAFIHDLTLPGMLHGRVLHPPAFAARLAAFDEAPVAAMPGVRRVVRDGSFIGVIAEREEQAVGAIEKAERLAAWTGGGPAPADPVAAMGGSDEPADVVHEAGDVEAARGRRFETTVSRHYLSHASIAPSCALALWDDGRLTVWTHAQGSHPLRDALAVALGLDVAAIDVIHRPGAGCYGHNGADDAALDAAVLARAEPGRPIRLVWSRGDEFGTAPMGSAMVTRAAATLDGHGRITAMEITVNSAPHGRRPGRGGTPNLIAAEYLSTPHPSSPGGDLPLPAGGADRNIIPYYAIPNVRAVKRIVRSLPYRTSSMRGLGGPVNVFAIETLIDDIAHATGADPVAFRLAHLDDSRARHIVERTAALAGWPGEQAGEGIGWGLGFARYKNMAAYCAVAVRVEVEEAVRVTNAWSALDAGECINPDGTVNQTEGGIIQAISWTLKEAVQFDGAAVASRDWETYPILRFSEVPAITVEIVDRPDEPPLGLAEAAQGPTLAAIGNAVRNAIGVRVRQMPITRDAIVAAMQLA